jgi:hypothetical protein
MTSMVASTSTMGRRRPGRVPVDDPDRQPRIGLTTTGERAALAMKPGRLRAQELAAQKPAAQASAVPGLHTTPAPAAPQHDSMPLHLMRCQATGGNQMVLRLLADQSGEHAEGGGASGGAALADRIRSRVGGGSPLPGTVRTEAEAGLGQPLGDVRVHTDAPAADMATQLNAQAFTTGNDVFFNQGVYNPGSPGGFNVLMHELTHTVQQASGPVGGRPVTAGLTVSDAHDPDERQAQAVADRVTAQRSALGDGTGEAVAGAPTGGGSADCVQRLAVQRLGSPLDGPIREGDPTPISADPGTQRKYTVDQYVEMWEAEQGRKLTEEQKETIARGCIGMTANNIEGSGNPPLDMAYGTFKQAHQVMAERNEMLDLLRSVPLIGEALVGTSRYIVFAQLFWSNQSADMTKRANPDKKAFKPDPDSGEVDMSDYEGRSQPGYVNFDFGWWDETTQSFWHANHADFGPDDPMIVMQSTPEKFAKEKVVGPGDTRYGYYDFDRVVYGVALAKNYDPLLAAEKASVKK